jgi:thiosulfate dehydrogenase (quinone) large subunit
LLVLRGFLGVTFTFAGLEKLANPNFFKASAPASFAAQVRGAILTSPLHGALRPALHAPVFVALLVAFGELAVGLGTLVGLFGRVAATGGMLLSLSFFLTVSFHDSPYYYGADIVFLFAWTPFLLGGSGAFSLDAALARLGTSGDGARAGTIDRRTALRRAGVAGGLGAFALALGGVDNVLGSHFSKSPTTAAATTTPGTTASTGTTDPGTAATTPTTSPSAGSEIGLASTIPVGDALAFTDQTQCIPAYCVHKSADEFVAFSAICTHAGCTVGFDRSAREFVCPCHGSIYNALTGAVIQGPAPLPLPPIGVKLTNGTLYSTD